MSTVSLLPVDTSPVTVLPIRPWPDPVIDALGHDPRSTYVEPFWLGILGPRTTWLLRRLAAGLDASPAGFDLDLADTAAALGLGVQGRPPLALHAGPRPLLPVRPGHGPVRRHPRRAAQGPAAQPAPGAAAAAVARRRPPGVAGGRAAHAGRRAAAPAGPAPGPQPARAGGGRRRHRAPAPPVEVPSRPVPGVGRLGVGPPPPGASGRPTSPTASRRRGRHRPGSRRTRRAIPTPPDPIPHPPGGRSHDPGRRAVAGATAGSARKGVVAPPPNKLVSTSYRTGPRVSK